MNADPLIGQEIDGYRILEVLGRGGMGVVYKAEEVALGREVAIKMIAHGLAGDESFTQKFQREARSLARVSSHHITGIYTLRRTDVGLFIAMEYVGGGSLRDRLEHGAMSWAEARPIVLQALTALHDAHSVGVVHRDIKPGNILLTEQGAVKVTDFGLAKLYEADSTATVTRAISGTLNYMAPEQVQGAHDLDGRTDLYALGMTIYEMLSGRLPFETGRGEFATMRTIVEEDFIPLSRFAKKLPARLEAAVMRALAKAPENRFADANAMSAAFEAIPATKVIPARKKVPARKAVPADEAIPTSDKATPAAFKAFQAAFRAIPAAFKAIPATFKSTPAAPAKRAAAETVVEEAAYVPAPAFGSTTPPWPLYALGGGFALVLLVLLAWWLLPRGSQSPILSIDTDPQGAVVLLNGEEEGVTPLEVPDLDLSEARLQVTLAGYAEVDTFLVFGDDPLALMLVLQRQSERLPERDAGLVVTSMPPRATVFVNDQRRGLTPYRLDSVGTGPLTVRVQLADHEVWRRTDVMPGQTLHAELQRVQSIGDDPDLGEQQRRERERLARLEQERLARLEQERLARLEQERLARLEQERLAQESTCDVAALTEQITKLEESCPLESNAVARSRCNSELNRLRRRLAGCAQ